MEFDQRLFQPRLLRKPASFRHCEHGTGMAGDLRKKPWGPRKKSPFRRREALNAVAISSLCA
jgi:hypothetical protein